MKEGRFSRTAAAMALFRALETTRPARERLFRDPWAIGFLPAGVRCAVRWSGMPLIGRLPTWFIDRRWPGARSSGVARTRLIDDWVVAHAAMGAPQIVILGAGFDTRAWRLEALQRLPVFEVDHPATAAEKRRRIASLAPPGSSVREVALDFDRERLPDALARAGFDATRLALVIWEGVTNYLTAEAVDAVLSWMGTLAPGSRLIFTYIERRVLDDPAAFEGAEQVLRAVAATGEPWTFGFDPAALPEHLRQFGLSLLEDWGADDYRRRYFGEQARGFGGYAFYRAALAAVEERRA